MHVRFFILVITVILSSCKTQNPEGQKDSPAVLLLEQLKKINGKHILFGHQDALAYGVGWKYQPGRCDVKEVSGQYPAVFGWDVAGLEKDSPVNIDSVPFNLMKQYIKDVHAMGGINTISWHMDNPLNGLSAWDIDSQAVRSILPGGSKHDVLVTWLKKFASFSRELKGSDGRLIPILFRPYHEIQGDWFWWGRTTKPADVIALWQFTFDFLKHKEGLDQLIWVYNTCDFGSEADYLRHYPGDEYIDVLSFDSYCKGDTIQSSGYANTLESLLAIQSSLALKKNKVSAIGETGYSEIPYSKWWSEVLYKGCEKHKPLYVLVWRNAGFRPKEKDMHYYAPYPGQVSASDFKNTVDSGWFTLLDSYNKLNGQEQ